jgi:two-component system heavy metal sensor histidine kinase CusS
MSRSIAGRLAAMFGLTALLFFSLAGAALYRALAESLDRQLEYDLHSKLEVVERLLGQVPVENWSTVRDTLVAIGTADGNTRFWVRCGDPAFNFGTPPPDTGDEHFDGVVRTVEVNDGAYPRKLLGRAIRPRSGVPEIHLVVDIGTESAARTLETFKLALLGIFSVLTIVVAALGYQLARYGLRPLARLSSGAQALSPRNLSLRLETPTARELAPLAASFNSALDRLEAAYQQLEGFNADVAHELRTPICNLICMTQVALTRPRSPDELQEALVSNLEELERLRTIVNDMLFLARADQGIRSESVAQVSLAGATAKTLDFLEVLVNEKDLTVEIQGDALATVDEALFQRAMFNLLHNAIQHTAPGETITVALSLRDNVAEAAVSNPGPGIAAEHLPRLFDRFYRVDPARASSANNHGLGLAIVKAIATMHGGSVFARSESGINTIGLAVAQSPQQAPHALQAISVLP